MDVQVSHARILIGDNVAPFTYSDAQLRAAITVPFDNVDHNNANAPLLPDPVALACFLTFMTWPFPVGS